MKKVGGNKNASISQKSNPNFQTAEFSLGYLYRDIETQLNAFGAENGGAISVTDAARWVGTLLLTKAGGFVLDGPEPVPDVRGGSTQRHEISIAAPPVHVRPRHHKAPVKKQNKIVNRPVTCRHCEPNKKFSSRKNYMKHVYQDHPEMVKKQREALQKAMRKAA